MGVVVVEPGQQRPPLQIDDTGRRSHLVPHLIAASDARDAVPDDGDRLGARAVRRRQ